MPYNVFEVVRAECTLEPMICLYCGSLEVTYHQYVGDAYCASCGKWQIENFQIKNVRISEEAINAIREQVKHE